MKDNQELSLAELIAKKDELQINCLNIQSQFDKVNARFENQGIPIDLEWERKAKYALKFSRIEVQKTEQAISHRRKTERLKELAIMQEKRENIATLFFDLAKVYLEPEVFHRIQKMAQDRYVL